jgi:biopolymer transport protein ExbD
MTLAVMVVSVLLGGLDVQATPDDQPIGKIAVTRKGVVSLDGTTITLDALKTRLADLKKRNGEVWYYREASRNEPPEQAMEVIKLVMQYDLPISLSTKPDYSDEVLPDGTVRARAKSGRR